MNLLKSYVEAGKTVIIVGSCGSGKSTLLHELREYISNEDRTVVVGWRPEVEKLKSNSLVGWDKNEVYDAEALVDRLEEYSPDRLVFDEVRGEVVQPVLDFWKENGKGLGTVLTTNVEMAKKYLVNAYMDTTLDDAPDVVEVVVAAIDVIVQMDYRRKNISEVLVVDKESKREIVLTSVYKDEGQ
ncbi:ATPase, T2SS/T4P/T4SS family [Bacillus mycoides]|uniref:ATPase, T2SS/T4P/T4SS family n=1 Tax=Bacillus mycoides TaxID=1405 RepID=UPI003A80CAD3